VPCAAARNAIYEKLHINMKDARTESETALNVCIQHVLDRTGLKPSQVTPAFAFCTIRDGAHPSGCDGMRGVCGDVTYI